MHHAPVHLRGFTLLELLVALTIFTLVGAGAVVMLRSVMQAHEMEQVHADALVRLQKAVWIMEQDFTQAQSDSLSEGHEGYAIYFIRAGWRNPLGLPRSDRERVAYRLEGDTLIRYYGTQGDTLKSQPLLAQVSGFSVRPVNGMAVEIAFTVQPFGAIRRVIEVP